MTASLRYRVLLLASLTAMTACTTQTAQSSAPPTKATTTSTMTTTTSTTPPAPTFPQGTAFTPEQVCQLVTPAELKSLSLEPEGQAVTMVDDATCLWTGNGSRMLLSVSPIPMQRLHLDAADKITKTEIAGRRALVIEDHTTCGVDVELTANSTIGTQGGRGEQGIEAHCLLARQTMDLALAKITK